MVHKRTTRKVPVKKEVKRYVHSKTKRSNNPPAGLANQEKDDEPKRQRYSFDPRLDPQLEWSGKKENSSFEIDIVSIHVHERIDPSTILEKVKKASSSKALTEFFDTDENNPPLNKALDFYEHEQGWSNRMIAGDSFLIMNSLLIKENMRNKVQMIYFDPPYGIKYGSNFQPFVNKRDVKFNDSDEDLTLEPEVIKAFRDTWELGIHSYLSYLRNRLLIAREILNETGSMFIQISDENVHRVRVIMDEVFGAENFVSLITFKKTTSATSSTLSTISDYLIWYAKNKKKIKYNQLFAQRDYADVIKNYNQIELPDGTRRPLTKIEKETQSIPKGKLFVLDKIQSPDESKSNQEFEFNGKKFYPNKGNHWSVSVKGLKRLAEKNRIVSRNDKIYVVKYLEDFPGRIFTNVWNDTVAFGGGDADDKIYVVQTLTKVIQRCMLMTTDPGDLVLDPTCGSGTTAYAAEKFGRRWITCDTSRISLNLAQRRLMTSVFAYYELAYPDQGVCASFNYETMSHITRSSIAYDEHPKQENLYDQPIIDKSKHRISGPFTIEAIPSPVGKSIDILYKEFADISDHISYQQEWRDELLNTGIRTRNNKRLEFTDIGPSKDTRWIHAIANTREDKPQTCVVSFGPPHGPLTTVQVSNVLDEAEHIRPKPTIVIFAAMQFDPEASKIIKETKWKGVTILKVDMNKDLLVSDLKKKQKDSESFWEVGQPDCTLIKKNDKYIVQINGFDYYDTKTDKIVSGDTSKISMWMLDTNYDGRSIYPEQVFFTKTVGNQNNEMKKLAKTLNRDDDIIDESLIEQYTGTESLPFVPGDHKRIAVKIIDDRGISTIDIIDVP